MASTIKPQNTVYAASLIAALLLFSAQCWWLYGSTARDDAFLSYWPAHTLAVAGEILNYNGERVEQSSTLLHTVWLAGLARLLPFLQIPLLGWLSSLLAAALTLVVTSTLLRRQRATPLAVLVLATVPGLLFWANSGMETSLTTLLLTTLLLWVQSAALKKSHCLLLAVVLGLTVMARPELFLVLLCFCVLYGGLHVWTDSYQPYDIRFIRFCFFITLFVALTVTAFRYLYFDQFFPQPVVAKSSGLALGNIVKGLFYCIRTDGLWLTPILLTGALIAVCCALLMRFHPARQMILGAGSLMLAQLAFAVTSGGDWMEGARFLMPVMPAATVALFAFLAPWRTLSSLFAVVLLAIGSYDSIQFVRTESTGFARWEREAAQQRYLPDPIRLGSPEVDSVQRFRDQFIRATRTTAPAYSAAEQFTKDALRDKPQLEALTKLIKLLDAQSHYSAQKPLEIMSIQMGFIPYHLSLSFQTKTTSEKASSFNEKLHFLDLRALSTRQLTDCALTRDFPHTDIGLKVGYDDFFAQLPALEQQCGIHKPDVIYDMGWKMRKDVLLQNGYRFVYLEPRVIQGDFSHRGIGSDLFIAVRNELIESAHLQTVIDNEPMTRIGVAPSASRPNIVLMMGDDISYDGYGFMDAVLKEHSTAKTPTIDQLAKEGVVFTTAHTPSAFCRPTLASLLTGQWPHQSRIHANNGVIALAPGYRTLATLLQEQGYATFAGGKFWENEPDQRGFDHFDVNRNTFARENQDSLWHFMDDYAGKQPMFIWWSPMLPHTPHNPPQQYLDQIDAAAIPMPPELSPAQQQDYRERQHTFLAMTLWMDAEMKKVYDKLAEKNLLDNTVIVYMADNGFSHRAVSKSSPYELGLRTPLIFHWPKHLAPRQIDAQTSTLHVYATLLDFAGINAAPELPSKSLLPVLTHQQAPVSETLFGASYQAVTIKTDAEPRPERDIFALSVRDGDWKYIFYVRDVREENNADLTIKSGMQPFTTRNAGDEELFHLPTDAIEQHNVSSQPDQQHHMSTYRKAVLQWWKTTGGKPLDSLKDCPATPVLLCNKVVQ